MTDELNKHERKAVRSTTRYKRCCLNSTELSELRMFCLFLRLSPEGSQQYYQLPKTFLQVESKHGREREAVSAAAAAVEIMVWEYTIWAKLQ